MPRIETLRAFVQTNPRHRKRRSHAASSCSDDRTRITGYGYLPVGNSGRAQTVLAEVTREIDMSKPSKEFLSPKTLMPPAGYSHIAKVNGGTTVYLAGQVSSDASGKLIGEGNFEAQVEQVFRNLRIAVEAAGGTMADIVKLNIYLVAEVNQADVPKLRAIRDRYVNVEKPPASTLVVVSRLARPGWLIEIEAVAAIDD